MSKNSLTTYRDEELGAALRELDVPDHGPSFFAELERRFAEERRRRARRSRLHWGLRIAVATALAAILTVAIGFPRMVRTPRIAGPQIASAAEIKANVRASLATMRNLSGVFVYDGPRKGNEERWRFALTADGDFRLVGPTDGEVITYDASTGVVRSAQTSASLGGNALFYAERRGVALGPPDQGPPASIVPHELGAFVRALLAAKDPRVREIAYAGRPAWRLDVDAVPNAIVPEFSGDQLEITVDRETGIPVGVVERKQGAFLRELRIEDLTLNGDLPRSAFRLGFPADAEVMRSDDGFRRVELGAGRGIVGYAPLAPAWVPDGYKLAEVAVARESGPTGKEAGNPPSRMVVSLSYRRGLDQFLVTTRLAQGKPWSDPLATGEGFVDHPEPLVIRSGALRGANAELLIVPRGIPHLWALTDGFVVTVGGDLSRDELIHVAESLRKHR